MQLHESYGDVHCYDPIGPEDIVDIWQPVHPEFDRLASDSAD
jgi:hypothetical protein